MKLLFMKKLFCNNTMRNLLAILLILLCCYGTGLGQDFESNFSLGIPVNGSTDWSTPSYDLDLMFGKKVNPKSIVGIGSTYEVVALKPSNTFLTYDRKVITFFSSYRYLFSISDKIKMLPQIRIGYSFIRSQLNEFIDKGRSSTGLHICGGIDASLTINKNFDFFTGVSFNTIFSKLEPNSNINIPQNYIHQNDQFIKQFKIKVGVTRYF